MRLSRDWKEEMRGSVLQAAYIIDDYGEVTLGTGGCAHAARAFETARSLVNDLGYIAYLVADRYIHIKLRPSLTSVMSYSRLIRWLDCGYPQRVLVSYLSADEWHHEFAGSARSAQHCIDRLMARYGGGPLGNIGREVVSLRSAVVPPAFRNAIAYWQANRAGFDPLTTAQHIKAILNDRFLLSMESEPGDFVIGAFGSNRDDRCQRWMNRALGLSVRSVPDSSFGASVANAYTETMRLAEPAMDNVDALVTWTGGARARHRYMRLMLPFIVPQGRWLLCCHLPAPRLRLLA
jgi:hypothetical protein